MQLADRSLSASPAGDRVLQVFSGQNRKAYLRLKLALSLSLRRQIFLAVCDDLALRNRIAARLYAELAYPSPRRLTTEAGALPRQGSTASIISPLDHRLSMMTDEYDLVSAPSKAILPPRSLYPRLVSLNLNLSEPNPMVQIAEWLAEYPPPPGCQQRSPSFQILGVERLTRQPAIVQKRFLHSLQQIEHYLSRLESPLLLWLPRPWLNAVRQSAPNFWNWHTALFEFEGDPTPVRSIVARLETPPSDPAPLYEHGTSVLVEAPTFDPSVPNQLPSTVIAPKMPPQSHSVVDPVDHPVDHLGNAKTDAFGTEASIAPTTTSAKALATPAAASQDNLWEILSHDLAQLDAAPPTAAPSDPPEPRDRAATVTPAIARSEGAVPVAAPQFDPDDQADETVIPLPISPAVTGSPAADPSVTLLASRADGSVAAPAPPPTDALPAATNTIDQSQSALALADLILAVVAEEGETSSSQNASIIQVLQQIEQLHLQQAPRATLLAAYQNLGSLCRDRIEQGNASSRHLLLTVCVYEQTLQWLDDASLLWSDVLNDIGNLYWMLSRQESAVGRKLNVSGSGDRSVSASIGKNQS